MKQEVLNKLIMGQLEDLFHTAHARLAAERIKVISALIEKEWLDLQAKGLIRDIFEPPCINGKEVASCSFNEDDNLTQITLKHAHGKNLDKITVKRYIISEVIIE